MKALTRNKSMHPSMRTPQALVPIEDAPEVLPLREYRDVREQRPAKFMRHPSLFNAANMANPQSEIQIADPHRALERRADIGLLVRQHRMNWSQLRKLDD